MQPTPKPAGPPKPTMGFVKKKYNVDPKTGKKTLVIVDTNAPKMSKGRGHYISVLSGGGRRAK